MSTLSPYWGIALVTAGALLLIVSNLVGWTSNNMVLLSGLFIIIIGVVGYVKQQKKGEKY